MTDPSRLTWTEPGDLAAVADRVAIMGAGRKFADLPVAGLTPDDLTHMIMRGNRQPEAAY